MQGMLDRYIISTVQNDGTILDQIIFKCDFNLNILRDITINTLVQLEQDLSQILLKIYMMRSQDSLSSVSFKPFPSNATWTMMIAAKIENEKMKGSSLICYCLYNSILCLSNRVISSKSFKSRVND
jgi:hypothetical protein